MLNVHPIAVHKATITPKNSPNQLITPAPIIRIKKAKVSISFRINFNDLLRIA